MILRQSKFRSRLLAYIVVFGISCVGTYVVAFSSAAVDPNYSIWDTTVAAERDGLRARYTFSMTPQSIGQSTCYTDQNTGRERCYDDYETNVFIFKIHNSPRTFTFSGNYTCGTFGRCGYVNDYGTGLAICIQYNTGDLNQHNKVPLITLELIDTQQTAASFTYDYYADTSVNGVDCENNNAEHNNAPLMHGSRSFGRAPYPGGHSPSSSTEGSTGSGSGTSGSGMGQTSGTGAGLSGSSRNASSSVAKTHDQGPASVPTSSANGISEQPEHVTPSPFYDGKTYEQGSDTDNIRFSKYATASKSRILALVVVCALFIVGIVLGIKLYLFRNHR